MGVLNAHMWDVLAVLDDVDRHREWVKNLSETRILERISLTEVIMYSRFDSPWPVSDRDAALHVTADIDPANMRVEIVFENIETPLAPPVDGVVRAPRLNSRSSLRALGPDSTELVYEVDADPGGSVPKWIVRWLSRKIPIDALKRLRAQIAKTKGEYVGFAEKFTRPPADAAAR